MTCHRPVQTLYGLFLIRCKHDLEESRLRQVRRSPLEDVLRRLLVAQREACGMTQAELAATLRRPQSYVSKVERGERRLEVVEFIAYARALGLSPQDVIAGLTA